MTKGNISLNVWAKSRMLLTFRKEFGNDATIEDRIGSHESIRDVHKGRSGSH